MNELLKKINDNNILLEVVDGKLKLFSKNDTINSELLAEIREKKEELTDFIVKNSQENSNSSFSQSIPKAEKSEDYPLSSSQFRLWNMSQFEQNSVMFNMVGVFNLEGNLNVDNLKRSFDKLIKRHEILRTVFQQNNQGVIRQIIKPESEATFHINQFDLINNTESEKVIQKCIENETETPFDLENGPLLRASLLRLDEHKWIFIYVMHHIISDGWSMNILINELFAFYQSDQKVSLETLPIQYKDYAVWQQNQVNNSSYQKQKEYWLKKFDGDLPQLHLMGDNPRPSIRTQNGLIIRKSLPSSLTAALKKACSDQGGTLFMGVIAAVNLLLHKYTGQEDIILGSPIAGRDHPDLENQIGFYVNTLALRTEFSGKQNFNDLFKQVKQLTLEAYDNPSYPFDELVTELNLQRDLSRNVLFDVWVVLQNITSDNERQENADIKVMPYQEEEKTYSKYDLHFDFEEKGKELAVLLTFNSDIFSSETAHRMLSHLEQLIDEACKNTNKALDDLTYLTAKEQANLLTEFTGPFIEIPDTLTLVDLFEEQVVKYPDHKALVFKEKLYTYSELNILSNQLGDYLRKKAGVLADDRVGIMLHRSEHLIITVLGILKSGAGYVPIDPEYPESRIEYMIKDSGCKVVINDDFISEFLLQAEKYSSENIAHVNKPQHLAYIIYTSGTTGQPKGVMIEHRNLINYVKSLKQRHPLNENDSTVILSSISWDGILTALFGALFSGSAVHIVDKEVLHSPVHLSRYLIDQKITFLKITPAMLNLLLTTDGENNVWIHSPLRMIFIGGEKINNSDINKIKQFNPQITIINHYGPTETTVGVTTEIVTDTNSVIPIGKPLANTSIHILDKKGYPVPVGVPGELCVSGKSVARGYINQIELTNDKFVKNSAKSEFRMYKTGDIARFLINGKIEFIGRRDEQVKIRGYRIELAEIENNIREYVSVNDVAAIVHNDKQGENVLLVYIVAGNTIRKEELIEFLSKRLPAYMLPDFYFFIDKMPINANGKLDKKALSIPENLAHDFSAYVAPRNETEEKLAAIWCQVLSVDKVGATDNFFELGGQSLKAIRLYSRISKEFDVKLELNVLFKNSLLEQQAELILAAVKEKHTSVQPAPIAEHYPMSSSQRRLWVLSQFGDANVAYSIPGVVEFEELLNFGSLNNAFQKVIERHEILRTVFKESSTGEIRQYILSPEEFAFQIQHEYLSNDESRIHSAIHGVIEQPFDLAADRLIRASLITIEGNRSILAFAMHHIISDGWSMEVMLNELLHFYMADTKGEEGLLKPLSIQYKDFAVWQQNQLNSDRYQKNKSYWLNQFQGILPVLELSNEKTRPAMKTYTGSSYSLKLSASLSSALKQLCKDQDGTLFMGLLAGLKTLFYKYSNQQDIIVGVPVAGREHIDFENQIGIYMNTLALRTQFRGEESFIQLFDKVKRVMLGAHEHQQFSFDDLVDELSLKRDMSRNPLFDVMLVGEGMGSSARSIAGTHNIKMKNYETKQELMTKVDIQFAFSEYNDELTGAIEYNTDIYSREFVKILSQHFVQLMEHVVQAPNLKLDELSCLNVNEKVQLLETFNATQVQYSTGKTLLDLFNEQLNKTANNLALDDGKKQLTYKELDERSTILAATLKELVKESDEYIAIHQNRGVEMVVSMFAILKAGKAYLPMEPTIPSARKQTILETVACSLVITDAINAPLLQDLALSDLQIIDLSEPLIVSAAKDISAAKICSEDKAYIIFTSGSTGVPKGVMVQHKPVVNLIEWVSKKFNISKNDKLLCTASISFDLSVYDIFGMLSTGGSVRIATNEELKDPSLLAKIIYNDQITFWDSAPVALQQLVPYFDKQHLNRFSLRLVFLSGDWIPLTLPDELKNAFPQVKTIALGGATEATVWSNYFPVEQIDASWKSIPYGKPIQNAKYYILNSALQPVPIGVQGDLYIGGEVLAMGYNDQNLSAKKFISNPFVPYERIYHTGDKARFFKDGNIEFLGREDDQVKIRGYRIELGDIESALLSYESIDAAVVVAKGEKRAEKNLVAYMISKEELNVSQLRSYLARQLPAYMIPSYFVQLKSIPLTANGKLDKKALPDPNGMNIQGNVAYLAPVNKIQDQLVYMWAQVLALEPEKIGIHHDFFELGGHSIKAMLLISRINKEFAVQLNPTTLFSNPTIEGVAEEIEKINWASQEGPVEDLTNETETFSL